MKLLATALCVLGLGALGLAQSRSVWIADYTGEEVMAEVAAGRTTLIYCGGATHADGPVVTTGKHVNVGRYVAQRVAEELGNALVAALFAEFNETTAQNVEHGKQAISLIFNDVNRDMRLIGAFRPLLGGANDRPSDRFETAAFRACSDGYRPGDRRPFSAQGANFCRPHGH